MQLNSSVSRLGYNLLIKPYKSGHYQRGIHPGWKVTQNLLPRNW